MKIELDFNGEARKRLMVRLEKTDEWMLARWLDDWLYGHGDGQPKCKNAEEQDRVTKKLRDIMHALEKTAYEKAV